jgi:anaerobic dimethyl sulfoxide reductase subunit B (iron-sulfur subunit)
VAACPTGACQKDPENGTVWRDPEVCIGCGACVSACPYEHPMLLPEGISGRCDGCKSFRDAGQNPVCVDACVMRALERGDIEELRAAHPDAVIDLPILPDSSQTGPNTVIQPYDATLNEDFTPFTI